MEYEELCSLNDAIASLHLEGDVLSYEINRKRRIKFPRGFLRSLNVYRSYFPFINNLVLLDKIAQHMMHRDTLHWLWLKTDIVADARYMITKFQLINLASILEAIVKHIYPNMPSKKDNVYHRIDLLQENKKITNAVELKELWAARNSIHLHLTGELETIAFTDVNYKNWHKAIAKLIEDLNIAHQEGY